MHKQALVSSHWAWEGFEVNIHGASQHIIIKIYKKKILYNKNNILKEIIKIYVCI